MATKLRLVGLTVALSLLVIPGLALAHFDNEDALSMTCASTNLSGNANLTDPTETMVAWWWCYGNSEYEELILQRDPKFSLSMQVDLFEEESPEIILATCSGELSTKDFGNPLPCGSENECSTPEGEPGHNCHIEEGDFEEAGLDINDVIPGLGDCEDVRQGLEEPGVTYTGDIKALHNAGGGNNNGRLDKGNRGRHDKDIEVCTSPF